MKLFIGITLSLCLASACAPKRDLDTQAIVSVQSLKGQPVDQIAFGSCNRVFRKQPMWQPILAQQPDLWIWLGDNVYADFDDMDTLKHHYDTQKQQPDYLKLKSSVPVIGTWDNNDYGKDDVGIGYEKKAITQQLAQDFLDIPQDSPLRQRQGMYQAYDIGQDNELIRVILLDVRYHRDTLIKVNEPDHLYLINETGDILGAGQWAWLEEQLTNSPAQIHLIGSGIQFISEEHRYEKWANYPTARQRMLDLLVDSQAQNVLFLSGDRHMAELSRLEVPGLPYPLFDFTSSGLTHTYQGELKESNRHQVAGSVVTTLNAGLISVDWTQKQLKLAVLNEKGELPYEYTLPLQGLE